jgi:hypothetical protein
VTILALMRYAKPADSNQRRADGRFEDLINWSFQYLPFAETYVVHTIPDMCG